MGELEKLLMPMVTHVGALSGWIKVAWLLWFAWGVAQLEWRRRSRVEPAWQPALALRSAIEPKSVSERPAPAATVVFELTAQPAVAEPESVPEPELEPATKPKRRRRSRQGSRVNGSIPAHAPVVPELSAD